MAVYGFLIIRSITICSLPAGVMTEDIYLITELSDYSIVTVLTC